MSYLQVRETSSVSCMHPLINMTRSLYIRKSVLGKGLGNCLKKIYIHIFQFQSKPLIQQFWDNIILLQILDIAFEHQFVLTVILFVQYYSLFKLIYDLWYVSLGEGVMIDLVGKNGACINASYSMFSGCAGFVVSYQAK